MANYDNDFKDFEVLLRRLELKLQRFLQRPKGAGAIFIVLLIFSIGYSSYYIVEPDEEAVVIRFGKYLKTTSPGPHIKFPLGIDKAIKVRTQRRLQEEFGHRTKSTGAQRTTYSTSNYSSESHMLTGDLNVAEVEWTVQYQISDAKKYLFHTRNPQTNIRDVSEAMMRRVVGDRLVSEVLTVGRAEIADKVKVLLQEVLVNYDMGIKILTVILQDVNPPDKVKPSFNEVNAAKQEQEQAINQAEKEYNRVIPEARGKAEEQIARAEGYATEIVNRAQGDADRFKLVLKEYKKAPRVTRERLYLEAMEKLFARLDGFTVVDKEITGLLPVFSGQGKAQKSIMQEVVR